MEWAYKDILTCIFRVLRPVSQRRLSATCRRLRQFYLENPPNIPGLNSLVPGRIYHSKEHECDNAKNCLNKFGYLDKIEKWMPWIEESHVFYNNFRMPGKFIPEGEPVKDILKWRWRWNNVSLEIYFQRIDIFVKNYSNKTIEGYLILKVHAQYGISKNRFYAFADYSIIDNRKIGCMDNQLGGNCKVKNLPDDHSKTIFLELRKIIQVWGYHSKIRHKLNPVCAHINRSRRGIVETKPFLYECGSMTLKCIECQRLAN